MYVFVYTCVFVLIMYVRLQWWLRGLDSCSVVWWSSPSREGAGGWHPSHWPPSGSLALLYSLPTLHIPCLNHAVSPCLSPPHTPEHIQHTKFWSHWMQHHAPPKHPQTDKGMPHHQDTEINTTELEHKGYNMMWWGKFTHRCTWIPTSPNNSFTTVAMLTLQIHNNKTLFLNLNYNNIRPCQVAMLCLIQNCFSTTDKTLSYLNKLVAWT